MKKTFIYAIVWKVKFRGTCASNCSISLQDNVYQLMAVVTQTSTFHNLLIQWLHFTSMLHATVTVATAVEAQQEVDHHLEVDLHLVDPLVEQVLIIYLYSKWGKNIDDMLHFAGKKIRMAAKMKKIAPTGLFYKCIS